VASVLKYSVWTTAILGTAGAIEAPKLLPLLLSQAGRASMQRSISISTGSLGAAADVVWLRSLNH
jgi:hypothetical protein